MTNASLSRVCISETTNEIAFISPSVSQLHYYTGNCERIGSVSQPARESCEMKSLCFSNEDEGLSVNVIAVGLSNGHIRLYSTWDLTPLREICINVPDIIIGEIICVVYSRDGSRLFALDSKSTVYVLQESSNTAAINNTVLTFLNNDIE